MKKNIIHLLLASGFALLANWALTSCGKTVDTDANDVLVVKSVLPTKVMEGQVVTITGTGLEKATTVVFPGNVPVKDITKVGNGYISVVTPAGIAAEGGAVTVEAGGESAESAMALTVGKPRPSTVAPLDKEILINECVEVYGEDLEFITKAYFPGEDGQDIVVPATDFRRKATGSLFIYSPMGIQAGPAQVVLEDCSGRKYTLPEVTYHSDPVDITPVEGIHITAEKDQLYEDTVLSMTAPKPGWTVWLKKKASTRSPSNATTKIMTFSCAMRQKKLMLLWQSAGNSTMWKKSLRIIRKSNSSGSTTLPMNRSTTC